LVKSWSLRPANYDNQLDGGMWTPKQLNTLGAIAPMFARVQVRIATEEKLRYLAEHDELTGRYNRRALVAHLSARLAVGSPGSRRGHPV
jgi:GAF domain-containing protein